jgi:hypothetical protein
MALRAGEEKAAGAYMTESIETARRQKAHLFLLKSLTTLLGAFPDGGPVPGARELFLETLKPMRAYADNIHVSAALELEARLANA